MINNVFEHHQFIWIVNQKSQSNSSREGREKKPRKIKDFRFLFIVQFLNYENVPEQNEYTLIRSKPEQHAHTHTRNHQKPQTFRKQMKPH